MTSHQVRRLSTLTNDLIYLSRMEEPSGRPPSPLPFSDLVASRPVPSRPWPRAQEKPSPCASAHPLTLVGEKSLGQLVSILLDNA